MPKFKTRKAISKRIKITGTGKLKKRRAARSHLKEKKPSRRRRRYQYLESLSKSDQKRIKKLITK